MRRWDYSITEISAYSSGISVTGREAFHMSMPTEVQSTSSLKKKKASPLLLLPIFWFALKKCFFRYSTVGGGISSAQSGSCDLSAKTRSLHKVL